MLLTFIMSSNNTTMRQLSQFPLSNRAVIPTSEQNIVILSHTSHRIRVSLHLFLKCGISDWIYHDIPKIASHKNLSLRVLLLCHIIIACVPAILIVQVMISVFLLIKLQTKDLFSRVFISRTFINFPVFDHMAELGENRGCLAIGSAWGFFGDFPDSYLALVITAD